MKTDKITQIILTADDGKSLTHGEIYGKTVVLPEGADKNEWYEISEAEYETIQNAEEVNE